MASDYKQKKKIISSSASTNHVVVSDGSTVASEEFARSTKTEGVREKALRKWIIPIPRKYEPVELTLLNRLVWVKYRNNTYWWPAILYNNYSEVVQQSKIWDQLDTVTRIRLNFLTMIFPNHPQNRIRIARLLGRPKLELIEVKKSDDRCEFYWQLPHLLPHAFDSEYFRHDPDLYYDWHRAFDQVEELLRDCLGKRFALNPTASNSSSSKSWLQRAREAEVRRWQEAHPCLATCCACAMIQVN